MVSVRTLIGSAAAVMVSTAALAADLGPPPMQYQPQPQIVAQGGWYLRGDVGIGVQTFSSFEVGPPSAIPSSFLINQTDMQDTAIFGLGAGYVFNNWLRFDVTGEYRTKSEFRSIGSFNQGTCTVIGVTGTCFDTFNGNFSAAVFMANAYIDLGTWWCLTPFIGAGVGGAWDRITGVSDIGPLPPGTVGFGFTQQDSSSWNLAWNVQAGVTFNVSDNFKVDLSWRHLDMGSPQSANIFCQNTGSTNACDFFRLKDVSSEDFRIGVRYMLQPTPAPAVMPLSTRG